MVNGSVTIAQDLISKGRPMSSDNSSDELTEQIEKQLRQSIIDRGLNPDDYTWYLSSYVPGNLMLDDVPTVDITITTSDTGDKHE